MKSFLLYFDMMDGFDALDDVEAGRVMKSIFHYAAEGRLPENLDPAGQMFFTFARHWLDLDKDKYNKKVMARAEAGRKGAQARQERREQGLYDFGKPREYESSDFEQRRESALSDFQKHFGGLDSI